MSREKELRKEIEANASAMAQAVANAEYWH